MEKYGRHWALYDDTDTLIAVIVYKKGAKEVMRRLGAEPTPTGAVVREPHSTHGDLDPKPTHSGFRYPARRRR